MHFHYVEVSGVNFKLRPTYSSEETDPPTHYVQVGGHHTVGHVEYREKCTRHLTTVSGSLFYGCFWQRRRLTE
jgi:hypothetical protein